MTELNPNQRRTLALLRVHGHLSRAELASELGLSRPALTEIVRVLTELGYVEEHGVGGNLRGQPKINLRLRARAACVLGVFVQTDRIQLMLADLTGEPLGVATITPTPAGPEQACDAIAAEVDRLIRKHSVSRKRLLAVGVAVSGFFVGEGDRIWPPIEMVRWREFPLKAVLAQKLALPVFLENDGNVAALAEHMSGVGRRFRNFLFVYLGYGVGGGFVHEGQIYTGAFGNACEIGRLVPPHPALRPTLNSLAYYLDRPVASISSEEISAWFAGRDARFFAFLQAAVRALHGPLAAAVVLLDPAAIVLGGKFPPEVMRWFLEQIDISNADTAAIPLLRKPALLGSEITTVEAGLLGAAVLPLNEFMTPRSP
ncbi:MAG: ROK family transcriptional regulator [Opitutae bacterium]|nr:ROK family transcriptional regulator [Opitutae bacterium]